jgi:hypothetical protein
MIYGIISILVERFIRPPNDKQSDVRDLESIFCSRTGLKQGCLSILFTNGIDTRMSNCSKRQRMTDQPILFLLSEFQTVDIFVWYTGAEGGTKGPLWFPVIKTSLLWLTITRLCCVVLPLAVPTVVELETMMY